MIIYLDESGDLGFEFDEPFNQGGSSKFLLISALIIPSLKSKLSKRIIRNIYKKRKLSVEDMEIKGRDLTPKEKYYFVSKVIKLLNNNPDCKIEVIIVNKINVQSHIQSDSNKLYNYMIRLLLLDEMSKYPIIQFCNDPRSIKIKSGNSLIDYLQTELWFTKNANTKINQSLMDSKNSFNIQFVDYICYLIWTHIELNNNIQLYKLLEEKINIRYLFF